MRLSSRPPVVDDDGEARELTDEDFLWLVRSKDFGGFLEANAFLDRRRAILRAAEEFGVPEEAFLAMEPSKPGFERRVVESLRAILKVAEEKAADSGAGPGMAAE
jgi:hypothetical protein